MWDDVVMLGRKTGKQQWHKDVCLIDKAVCVSYTEKTHRPFFDLGGLHFENMES